ncbi:MAG: coenzyme F420 hydrogenase subunit gamma, partial [Methanoculleus horonobensis]|nr:coenzyme F420 hydrogenase subunit gamma [Methanoculleus horonobensis]
MGLLSTIKERIFGRRREKPPEMPGTTPGRRPEAKPAATTSHGKPAVKPSDVIVKEKVEVVQKEEKPVAEKITIGELHLSGCTGCLVTLADNYEGL